MWQNLKQIPIDPIFGIVQKFREDPNPNKINLSVGIYSDEAGKPFVFPSVKDAITKIQTDNFGYLPMRGNDFFLNETLKLFLGKELASKHIFASQQSCGGTHACKLLSDLLKREQGKSKIMIGNPTWENHFQLFNDHEIVKFNHLTKEGSVDAQSYQEALKQAEDNAVLILHGGLTHNPTGLNLQTTDLENLIEIINEKQILVFVDFAYLGFGEGIAKDRKSLQFLVQNVDKLALGVSYSKNASLYRQRTGGLFIKVKPEKEKNLTESNLQNLVRGSISNLPDFGAEVMSQIFDKDLDRWFAELEDVRLSIVTRRKMLVDKLPDHFKKLGECSGMFGLLGLSQEQVIELREKHHLYMPENSRINFGGIKIKDIDQIVERISSVI